MYCFSKLAVKTDVGKKRKINEDCVATFRTMRAQGQPEFCQLIAVADGMGGHNKGEIASSIAVNTFFAEIVKGWQYSQDSFNSDLAIKLVQDAYLTVNEQTYNRAQTEEFKGMGTTLVIFIIFANANGSCHIMGNVGDSRCYIMDDNNIIQLSRDDSEVQDMVDRNEITPLEARSHPHKNRITNAIGVYPNDRFNMSVKLIELSNFVDLTTRNLHVVLCSDGLHTVLFDKEIYNEIKKAKDLTSASNKLIDLANSRGGPDNISVVIGKLTEGRL